MLKTISSQKLKNACNYIFFAALTFVITVLTFVITALTENQNKPLISNTIAKKKQWKSHLKHYLKP